MGKIKKNDFVEVEYTGKLVDDKLVFDTTDENIAKDGGIFDENHKYGPVIICVGEKQILEGIDKNLEGKEDNNTYTLKLSPEDGFGKKSGKMLKLIPATVFRKQNIQAVPGLQVNIDGVVGTVRRVSGGRVIVDFNHPLSGKELEYIVKVNNIVTDSAKKVESIVHILLNQDCKVSVANEIALIELETKLPDEIGEKLKEEIVKFEDKIK